MQVGAASEYPQCFLDIDRKKEKKKILKKIILNVKKKLSRCTELRSSIRNVKNSIAIIEYIFKII